MVSNHNANNAYIVRNNIIHIFWNNFMKKCMNCSELFNKKYIIWFETIMKKAQYGLKQLQKIIT